jgi:hypothetical protein
MDLTTNGYFFPKQGNAGLVTVNNYTAECSLRLKPCEHDGALLPPQIMLEMMAYPASVAHAA